MAYVGGPRTSGCIFCHPPGTSAREQLVLGHSAHALVMLNRYPYQNGHLLVAPKRHTADLATLPANEYAELAEVLRRAVATLGDVLHPDGFNVGANLGACAGAGVADHMHWHIVPRWTGDTNFMPVLAEVRVMPQHLHDGYDQLAPHFGWLSSAA